jgi:hypothetical protein
MIKEDAALGKFPLIRPMTHGADGVLYASINIRVATSSNFPGELPDYLKGQ